MICAKRSTGIALAAGVSLTLAGVDAQMPFDQQFFPVVGANTAAEHHPANVMVRTTVDASADLIAAIDAKAGVTKVLYKSSLVPGLRCVRVADGGVFAAIAVFAAEPVVRYAEPDFIVHAAAQETPYGVINVNAPGVWSTTRGQGVVVADLDTGVDLNHPDLPIPLAITSFTGESVQDGHGHGTHTAGTIGAIDNTFGVIGVAPEVSLLVGKVLSNGGSGQDSWVAAGIDWAVSQHARVINMSLGGAGFSQSMADTCDAALAANTLVVAAAGNSNTSDPFYPAAYPSVLAVAAVNSSNTRAGFSNFGPHISLSAPGVAVASTFVGGGTATWQGVTHNAGLLSGSGPGPVTAEVVFCGLGYPEDFPTAGITGKIAHIRRGTLLFIEKTNNAIAAGAVGVIISNNVAGSFAGTLNSDVAIPVVGISQSDGDSLESISPAGEVAATIETNGASTYASLNGTSMAAPHVSGVAALLSGVNGGQFTAAQIRAAMEQTAIDLGDTGRDDLYGFGLVNAGAAKALLVSSLPAFCVADIGAQGGIAGHDGSLDNNDFIVFIDRIFAQDSVVDLGLQGGSPGQDGQFDNNDFIAFIDAFFNLTGCP